MSSTATNKSMAKYLNVIISILFVAVIAFITIHFLEKPSVDYLQGQAEATEIHVAPKVAGRLEKKLIEEGQPVTQGQLLAVLSIPELDAKLLQAESSKDAANAEYQKALAGTRKEQIQGAYNTWQKAKAATELSEVTYKRMENLYNDKVIPAQKRDEALAASKADKEQEAAAYSNYQLALNGARKEDKQGAMAMVKKAEGAIKEVNIYRDEVKVTAPANGEIEQYFPNIGELVNAGYPIVTIVDLSDIWVVFNIREDLMNDFKIGNKFEGTVPALGNKKIQLEVKYISPLGDFATWTATKTKGSFDLRTFKVKAYPVSKVEGFRPGMSVLVPSKKL